MHYLTGLTLALFVASPALAEDWDFVLTNGTGKSIKMVEIAPTGSTDWKPGCLLYTSPSPRDRG